MTAPLTGTYEVAGDKSISHRAAILGALAHGTSVIRGFSQAGDCASTLAALDSIGVTVERDAAGSVLVHGPLDASPRDVGIVGCGRAGTAMRLLAGVLASFPLRATLTGDPQVLRRPMRRVAEPLRAMGARVELADGEHAPIHVEGGGLGAIDHAMSVASAQVKSAVLLAGLRADGRTSVDEPAPTRDHTERMLAAMGAAVGRSGSTAWVEPSELSAIDLSVPGDPSSAAFLWAAAALVPGSDLAVDAVGLNPTRTGFLRILERMGGDVRIEPAADRAGEPVGAVRVRHAPLTPTRVDAREVPSAIDELPMVALLATQADGVTEVRGARELRVKESDRISVLVTGLHAMGANAEELDDGFVVRGPTRLHGAQVDAAADHRLAMTFAVAGLVTEEPVRVGDLAYAGDSFPGFEALLDTLTAGSRT